MTDVWSDHRNPTGLLYGAVVTGAVFALTEASDDRPRTIAIAVLEVLVVFWAAHVYTRVLSDRLIDPGSSFLTRTREALLHELAVLEGGAPAVAVFAVWSIAGAESPAAINAALATTVVVLGSAGYVVGRRAGARGPTLLGEIAAAALLGLVVVGLKVALH